MQHHPRSSGGSGNPVRLNHRPWRCAACMLRYLLPCQAPVPCQRPQPEGGSVAAHASLPHLLQRVSNPSPGGSRCLLPLSPPHSMMTHLAAPHSRQAARTKGQPAGMPHPEPPSIRAGHARGAPPGGRCRHLSVPLSPRRPSIHPSIQQPVLGGAGRPAASRSSGQLMADGSQGLVVLRLLCCRRAGKALALPAV